MKNSPNTTLLQNTRAVLPQDVRENTSILIEGGVIKAIFDSSARIDLSTAASILDLRGSSLYPGFIDLHIHGAMGVDTMEASEEDLKQVSQFLASHGVTGWLPTLVPSPVEDYARAISSIENAKHYQDGARILGVHYEGPFVSSAQCGALRQNYFRTFSGLSDLDELPVLTQRGIHMMTLAPEVEGGIQLVRELAGRGWIVSIGHTRADYDQLDQAFYAGAHHMTHFMNAMAPLHHRSPGPVGWGLMRDDVSCDVIADGVHIDRRMLELVFKVKRAERMILISDAISAAGAGDGDYQIWGETITVRDGRTSNSRGSIAGSVITMLDAVRMMKSLDVSLCDLSQMGSMNPARLVGIQNECGSIEVGKRADLVALDAAGNVHLTMIGGEVVFQR